MTDEQKNHNPEDPAADFSENYEEILKKQEYAVTKLIGSLEPDGFNEKARAIIEETKSNNKDEWEALQKDPETMREILDGLLTKNLKESLLKQAGISDMDAYLKDESAEEKQNLFPNIAKGMDSLMNLMIDFVNQPIVRFIAKYWLEWTDIAPYFAEELKSPEYEGKTLSDLAKEENENLFKKALANAMAARDAQSRIEAQNAGRERRRHLRENAEKQGAIMDLREGTLPVFSAKDLWDAFAPGRISKMGTLSPDYIDPETGRVDKTYLEDGEVVPLNATEISYKAFMLLNAIIANSVENFREEFIAGGAITFYVKGVLDKLEIDPRIRDDMQLNLDRKTAGVLYLEKQFEPLLSFIGTTPDGSRYSVFNYDGYDVESDTMTVRTPYLFRLWRATQTNFSHRKAAKAQHISSGKKPLKDDLKPLEVNMLFMRTAYKEDDAVLEIATYITNVLLNAGKGGHKTEIKYKTLIKNCPRIREKLNEIENRPATRQPDSGKRQNNTARYNTELRKIARAYSLIMNPLKCTALKNFEFLEFMPTETKDGITKFIPPTKSTLDGKITIKWRRIDSDSGT